MKQADISLSFTSLCKKDGTDLLIFFMCSGSENMDEDGDGGDDPKDIRTHMLHNQNPPNMTEQVSVTRFTIPSLPHLRSALNSCLLS